MEPTEPIKQPETFGEDELTRWQIGLSCAAGALAGSGITQGITAGALPSTGVFLVVAAAGVAVVLLGLAIQRPNKRNIGKCVVWAGVTMAICSLSAFGGQEAALNGRR